MTDDPGGTMPLAYYLAGGILALSTLLLPVMAVVTETNLNSNINYVKNVRGLQ